MPLTVYILNILFPTNCYLDSIIIRNIEVSVRTPQNSGSFNNE